MSPWCHSSYKHVRSCGESGKQEFAFEESLLDGICLWEENVRRLLLKRAVCTPGHWSGYQPDYGLSFDRSDLNKQVFIYVQYVFFTMRFVIILQTGYLIRWLMALFKLTWINSCTQLCKLWVWLQVSKVNKVLFKIPSYFTRWTQGDLLNLPDKGMERRINQCIADMYNASYKNRLPLV